MNQSEAFATLQIGRWVSRQRFDYERTRKDRQRHTQAARDPGLPPRQKRWKTIHWSTTKNATYDDARKVDVPYKPGVWQEVIIDLSEHPQWIGNTITRIRINPCNKKDTIEIDWVRFE